MSKKKVLITEVGPRDGFQNIANFIPTEEKIKIVNMLTDAGVNSIEVSSFVHPKWIPQLRDAAEVFAKINKKAGGTYRILIPNEKGLDRAIEAGVKEVQWVCSCSDSSNKENLNMTIDESLAMLSQAAKKAKEHGIVISGAVANALGCPWEGMMPIEKVNRVINAYRSFEINNKVIIADSIGMSGPEQVKTLFTELHKTFPDMSFAVHLHDILGIGTANAYAAYEAGVGEFESSISGLGGCPYTVHPGGNLATENMVNMFNKMDIETGIDLDKLLEASNHVKSVVGENHAKQEGHPEDA